MKDTLQAPQLVRGGPSAPAMVVSAPCLCAAVPRVLAPSSEQLVTKCTSLVLRDLPVPAGQPSVHRLPALKVQGEKDGAASLTCCPRGKCGPLWLGWWLNVQSEVSRAAPPAGKGVRPGPTESLMAF